MCCEELPSLSTPSAIHHQRRDPHSVLQVGGTDLDEAIFSFVLFVGANYFFFYLQQWEAQQAEMLTN